MATWPIDTLCGVYGSEDAIYAADDSYAVWDFRLRGPQGSNLG